MNVRGPVAAVIVPAEPPYGEGSETCCADCGYSRVMWCPAFRLWLCGGHADYRTRLLLGADPVVALPNRDLGPPKDPVSI